MGEPSYTNIRDQVDDFCISALSNGDNTHDLIPISDENYFSAITISPQPVKIAWKDRVSLSLSSYQAQVFCKICMETVPANEVLQTSNNCPHVFCTDCLSRYIGTKIRENIFVVRCPEENCNAVLEPGMCQDMLPSQIFKRRESALCESVVLGAQKSNFGENLLMMQEKETKWSCPQCKYFGENRDGCLHITCRCCLCSSVSTDTESLSSHSFSHADGSISQSKLVPTEVAVAGEALKQDIKVVEVTALRSVSRGKTVVDVPNQTTTKKKLAKEVLSKADAAGSSGLYHAYKGPEGNTEASETTNIYKSEGTIPTTEEAKREVITSGETVSGGDCRMGGGVGPTNQVNSMRIKSPGLLSPVSLMGMDMGQINSGPPNVMNLRPDEGSHTGMLKYPQEQSPNQFIGGILSPPVPQGGGLQCEVGKISNKEEEKQLQLKAMLNKLTPQTFDKVFEQVKEVNIDSPDTLVGIISQIVDKAIMQSTLCEMYVNFCSRLATALPNFIIDNEKITFGRLLLNKCLEEFERGVYEEAEAYKTKEEEAKQSQEEREEKRLKATRRMSGNIRLVGELYKKKMLSERIMHTCLKQLSGPSKTLMERTWRLCASSVV